MEKIRVSAVSYTNTTPFVYGLQCSGVLNKIELSLDIPSVCAYKLINNKADIGLVPVAALPEIQNHQIISDYCIGATGAVNSVFIFSDKPIKEIKTLRLDKQSRTSNNLALVLLKNYWEHHPLLVTGEADAYVEIGDRTFGKKERYPFVYDLAQQWHKFTGLPFAFAVWAANKPLPETFIAEFNLALKYGLDHRKEIIAAMPHFENFDVDDYLMHNVDFNFTRQKKQALIKFLELMKAL